MNATSWVGPGEEGSTIGALYGAMYEDDRHAWRVGTVYSEEALRAAHDRLEVLGSSGALSACPTNLRLVSGVPLTSEDLSNIAKCEVSK